MRHVCVCVFTTLLLAAPLAGQTTPPAAPLSGFSGEISVAGGGAQVEGDRARFQQHQQQRKSGFIGIEELHLTRELGTGRALTVDGRGLHGNEDYRLAVRLAQEEAWHIAVGGEAYRLFYDGSGGYFPPTDLWFELFDDALHVDRSRIWFEAGTRRPEQPQFTFRYERHARSGRKGSTSWGDTNLPGTFGTRAIVPSFWNFDEERDVFTLDVAQSTARTEWAAGARYERSEFENDRNMRRRPNEPTADRIVTSKEAMTTDIFSLHGFVQRQLDERFTYSVGALVTRLDTDLGGSRIYGQSYDPIYDPVYLRRQQRDEGFYHLTGGSNMRQYVANFNLVYQPTKHWQIRPALRFERTRTENISEFLETNVSAALAPFQEEVEGESAREWKEAVESIEARFTGQPNWTFSFRGEWLQGTGNLEEHRVTLETGAIGIDRDTDLERITQKYSFNTNWYAGPGLTIAAQYFYKVRINDYDTLRDNTPNTLTSGDRYPGYITDQDFETHDYNVRVTWRPSPLWSVTSRYDFQRSTVRSSEAGLGEVLSSRYRSHILSEQVMVNPLPRLYLTGGVTVAFDQIYTPASEISFVKNSDNNYITGSLGGGYALNDATDLHFNFDHYQAKNFIDNSALTQPYGADERRNAAGAMWVFRASEHLVYNVRYTYATYRDRATTGRNDYDAHIVYGKVQYRF